MARLPRFHSADVPQHVIQRGNNRTLIFREPGDYDVCRNLLRQALEQHECALHAYVFMSNHLHLLVSSRAPTGISRAMQSLGRRYVRHFNDRYTRTGTLWEGRFRATVVQSQRYLLACARYIEENPVRAGMVETPLQYPWSSHGANAFGRADPLVTAHPLQLAWGMEAGDRYEAYRRLFHTQADPTITQSIRDATQHAWALGDAGFCRELSASGRRATALPRGPGAARRTRVHVLESDPKSLRTRVHVLESDPKRTLESDPKPLGV